MAAREVRSTARTANRLRRLWRRLVGEVGRRPFDEVTDDDIYYCYRLLLKREPDPDGWRVWKDHADRRVINLQALADGFLASPEFRARQADVSRPQLVALDGFSMFVRRDDHFIGAGIARDRTYESHVTAELRRRLRPGAVFVDVGANIGYFTLLAAALTGPEGRVIAFEPNPENCAVLERSLAANAFTNVDVHPYAAAERRLSCGLEIAGTNSNGTLVDEPVEPDAGHRLPIEAVAIDDVLRALPRLDLVKMDIEGAEPRAFQGMRELVRTHRPVLITEFSPELIERVSRVTPVSFLDQLRAAGYDLSVLGPVAPRGAGAQDNRQILALHAASGTTHLDLLATPRTLLRSP